MEVESFVEKLVEHIKRERVFEQVLESVEKDKVTWDKAARKLVGSIVKELYQEIFPGYDVRENVSVEGEGMFKRPKRIFGSYGQFPDIRILRPKLIAIELEHAKGGNVGSRYKMALAKAAFNVLCGDWEYSIVLFHNHSGKSISQFLSGEIERKTLDFYETKLNTKVYLFE
jgi:hypothetical protein